MISEVELMHSDLVGGMKMLRDLESSISRSQRYLQDTVIT